MNVVVEGVSQGRVNFKIDHAEWRIADQSNVPTWLHWGALGETLQRSDYSGAWVILERLEDSSHRLEITREAPRGIVDHDQPPSTSSERNGE